VSVIQGIVNQMEYLGRFFKNSMYCKNQANKNALSGTINTLIGRMKK
jgi:hypothetical protein